MYKQQTSIQIVLFGLSFGYLIILKLCKLSFLPGDLLQDGSFKL